MLGTHKMSLEGVGLVSLGIRALVYNIEWKSDNVV